MIHYFIGIDPGVSGGIALIDASRKVVFATSTPDTEANILRLLTPFGGTAHAALERVWSSRGWGHAGAFKFGTSYGALRMALTATRVEFLDVLPRQWQKLLGVAYPKTVNGRATTATDKKNITKARAQAIFVETRVTHATADALLLAEYARRMFLAADAIDVAPSALQRSIK